MKKGKTNNNVPESNILRSFNTSSLYTWSSHTRSIYNQTKQLYKYKHNPVSTKID